VPEPVPNGRAQALEPNRQVPALEPNRKAWAREQEPALRATERERVPVPPTGQQAQELKEQRLREPEPSVPVVGEPWAPPASIPKEGGRSWARSWWCRLHPREGQP
jgi:hypothetical protein